MGRAYCEHCGRKLIREEKKKLSNDFNPATGKKDIEKTTEVYCPNHICRNAANYAGILAITGMLWLFGGLIMWAIGVIPVKLYLIPIVILIIPTVWLVTVYQKIKLPEEEPEKPKKKSSFSFLIKKRNK